MISLARAYYHIAVKVVEEQWLMAETGDKAQVLALFNATKATFEDLDLKRLQKEAEQCILDLTT